MADSTTPPVPFVRSSPVGQLANGEYVWEKVDGSHLDEHPDARPLVAEALEKIQVGDDQGFFIDSADLGRIVGGTSCVPTGDDDNVVYMMRTKEDGSPARAGFTRFVRGRDPIPTSFVTVLAFRHKETKAWILITSWVGVAAEKEPWDPSCSDDEYVSSCSFWETHALCDDGSNPVNRELVSVNAADVGYFNRRLPIQED